MHPNTGTGPASAAVEAELPSTTAAAERRRMIAADEFIPQTIIAKKRRNTAPHTPDEISWFISAFLRDEVKDYQMTAWLMAVCLNGMTDGETAALTRAMVDSGATVDWTPFEREEGGTAAAETMSKPLPHKVDKHSTGGVGDKTSLILAPLVASFGLMVPMMAGRGLGHTGGTIDKIESIPGFNTSYTASEFAHLLVHASNEESVPVRAVIASPGEGMCPADRRMYALRDVTATVTSLPLQTSSIMSKKIAEGPDSLVLDVKFGKGSFNAEAEESLALATSLIRTGELCGMRTEALVTRMDDPLGASVGNWLEVRECIDIMRTGEGAEDLVDLTVALAARMLLQGGAARTMREGAEKAREHLRNGAALAKFRDMVVAQGGEASFVDDPEKYPTARYQVDVLAPRDGYVSGIDAMEIGETAVLLGAGRKHAEEAVDFTAGMVFHKRRGDFVKAGDALARLHTERGEKALQSAVLRVDRAYSFVMTKEEAGKPLPLVTHFVTIDGAEEFDMSILEK